MKWSFGSFGKAPTDLTHETVSHHKGSTLLQLKKRCAASSSKLLQNRHNGSTISTCLPLKFIFVGKRSLMSLHVNTFALGGILVSTEARNSHPLIPPLFPPAETYMQFWSNRFHSSLASKPISLVLVAVLLALLFPLGIQQPL